jgi:PDZ domain-containing protein
VARLLAAIAIGLIVGSLGGFWVAKVGLPDRPMELPSRTSRAVAETRPEDGSAPYGSPASATGPIEASRVAIEAGEESAPPASVLARTSEATRDAPRAVKVAGAKVIRGRIVDVDGRPVAGVTVRTGREDDGRGDASSGGFGKAAPPESLDAAVHRAVARFYSRQADLREVATDRDGNYQFDGLRDGLWWVAAWSQGFDVNARGRGEDDEGDAQVRPDATLDFVATPVIEVPIAVVMPDGSPAPRAAIAMTGKGRRESTRSVVWSAAHRTVGLLPGRWQLQATLGDPIEGPSHPEYLDSESQAVEIAAGGETPLVTLRLKSSPGIRGEVRFSGVVPSSDQVSVKLMRITAGASPDLLALARRNEAENRSQRGLRYFFKDLAPGRYLLGVSRRWRGSIVDHAIVDVEQGVAERDLELPPIDPANCLILTATDAEGRTVEDLSFNRRVDHDNSSTSGGIDGERLPDGSFRFSLDDLYDVYDAGIDPGRSTTTGEWPEGTSVTLTVNSKRCGQKRLDLKPAQRRADVVFGAPARLLVTVAGVQGSGFEGRLDVALVEHRDEHEFGSRWNPANGEELSADRTATFGPLDPGDYDVQLRLAHAGGENAWKYVVASAPISLVAGENRTTVAMPALYSLTIEVPADVDDRTVQCYRKESENDGTSMGQASVDATRHASFENLPEGTYEVSCGGESMSVRVPVSGPVRLQSKPLDALRVYIQDEEGRLARSGLKDGDLIHRVDGTDFKTSADFEKAIGARLSNKSIVFTITRGGRDVELTVECSAFTNPFELGGVLEPASR